MEGEETCVRPKRCLSRSKRSKVQKSSQEDSQPGGTRDIYTAVRSKQTNTSQPCGEVVHFESAVAVLGVENEKPSEVEVPAENSKAKKHDAFQFCDDADAVDDDNSTCSQWYSNKRKRINSEETEAAALKSTICRFKRARKAVSNLNQPLVVLEKCAYQRNPKIQSKMMEENAKRRTETGDLQNVFLQEEQNELDFTKQEGSELSNSQESNSENEDINVNINNAHNQNKNLALINDLGSIVKNQVCPVCSLEFLITESMDVVNHHINNCLDNGVNDSSKKNNSVSENGFSQPPGESAHDDLFFCVFCQKDLSKMNSQRRGQHVNRCCDQSNKSEDISCTSKVQSQRLNLWKCPICGKAFKSSKTRQSHLKKCAQEYNVSTNQLLEIMHREKQEEETLSAARINQRSVSSISIQPVRSKRKRTGVSRKDELDEETQIALALSASMAPPQPPDTCFKKAVKGKGKRKKGDNEVPPLLLRDDESAQRAVAMRAAQVLSMQDNEDDEDEISCTPALAPSRVAENKASCLAILPVCDTDNNFDSTNTSDSKEDGDDPVESIEIDKAGSGSVEDLESSFTVDPEFRKSFLNFLYNAEAEENSEISAKVPRPSPLWSLAALKEQPSIKFLVPGLIPPLSPQKEAKRSKNPTGSDAVVINGRAATEVTDSNIKTMEVRYLEPREQEESTMQKLIRRDIKGECAEVTPSQAADVEMLLELVQDDDSASNVSLDSQHVIAASGFCIDQHDSLKEVDSVRSGVPKLLQDLSSMINNSSLSDVIIKLQGGLEMVAHSFILAMRSKTLAQLLTEQKALCEETAYRKPWTGHVCLQFDDVRQSVFEPVLRHMYTGDVSIPNENELDGIMKLAERFRLPCLLKACKATQEKSTVFYEGEDNDGVADFAATNLDKLEENLWHKDNEDELDDNFQTSENQDFEDDILNDDDIEEIMIFQTQMLRRKQSLESGNERLTHNEGLSQTSVTCNNCGEEEAGNSGELSCRLKGIEISIGEDGLLHNSTEEGNMSHRKSENGNQSHNSYKKDALVNHPADNGHLLLVPIGTVESSQILSEKGRTSQKPYASANLSPSNIATETVKHNPGEDSHGICGHVKCKEIGVLSKLHGTGIRNEEQRKIEKQVCGDEDLKALPESETVTSAFNEKHLMFMYGDGHVSSHSKGTQREVETTHKEECFPINEGLSQREDLTCIDSEWEGNSNLINESINLSIEDLEGTDGDKNRLVEVYEMPKALSDCPSLANEGHSPSADLTLLVGEERLDEMHRSPREVNTLEDDEVEEPAVDVSITLISDKDDDDEASDVSSPKTNLAIVPETPRISRSLHQRKSSSTNTFSEENDEDGDVSFIGSSPSKTRKKLEEEATKYLFELKERVMHGKGKKQGKAKIKKNGSKKSVTVYSVKHTSPSKKQSPRCRQENEGAMSQSLSDITTSPRVFTPQGSLPVGHSPHLGGNSPMLESPIDFGKCISPIWEPEQEQEGSAPDYFTAKQSSPQSPVFVQLDSAMQSSGIQRKEKGDCVSQHIADFAGDICRNSNIDYAKSVDHQDSVDVEVVDNCAYETEGDFDRLAVSFQDVVSPPVPSPDFIFVEPLLHPASPSLATSQTSVDPVVAYCKSPVSESMSGDYPQANSPMSPSVCSFSSHHADTSLKSTKGECVKKLELKQSVNNKESVKLAAFDPDIPLMERIRAARNGNQNICLLTNGEDSSDNSIDSIVEEFECYDDGGYNVDIMELKNLENCVEDLNVERNLEKEEISDSKLTNLSHDNKGTKNGVRKMIPNHRRKEKFSNGHKKVSIPKKQGQEIESHLQKPPGPTVSQPLTPMPMYHEMDTPTLKNELHNFGVRPLPKKKMILKLKEIYDYTHQVIPPYQESKNEPVSHPPDSLTSTNVGSHDGEELEGSGTASSDDSGEGDTEFGDCTIMIEDEAVTASQQVNSWNLKERLTSYIQSNPEMYKKILKFQPLELVSLHQNLKADGINCGLGKLVDFLDEQCITFTTAGSRTRVQKRRGRKKKNKS